MALIIVLWAVVMLSTVATSMVSTGRNDVALARNLRAAAVAAAAADGAVHQAAFHLIPCGNEPGCAPWSTGTRIDASRGGVSIAVCLTDEAGKVNPNTANAALLGALLTVVGIPPDQAAPLGAAIVAWRSRPLAPSAEAAQVAQYRQAGLPFAPDGKNFTAVDDVGYVIGMTPAVLAKLRPELSVWNEGDTDPALASPVTKAALKILLDGFNGSGLDGISLANAIPGAAPRTVAVRATAVTKDGARFTRSAVVRVVRDPSKAPLEVLMWSTAPDRPCA